MNPTHDYALTLVLLAPLLAAGTLAIASRWYATPPPARARRRLTDDELRRLYPLTAERAGKFPSV
jgi:hypothetical protein